jgi:hypothetical protein
MLEPRKHGTKKKEKAFLAAVGVGAIPASLLANIYSIPHPPEK